MTAADISTGYRALALVICGSPGRPRRWATRAACADQSPALFAQEATEVDALAVCAGCPVLFECRADVLAFERSGYRWRKSPTGVVGGLTAEQRREIYRAEDRDKRQCSRTGQDALFSPADVALRAVQRRDVGVMRRAPVTVHRRILQPGKTWLSIRGERGRFRYLGYSTSRAGDVSLSVYGGRPGHELTRSFRPERVRTVHLKGGGR